MPIGCQQNIDAKMISRIMLSEKAKEKFQFWIMRHFRCEFGGAAASEMHSLHFYGALGFALVRNGGVGNKKQDSKQRNADFY